jgi:xylulokinase
VADPLVIGLDSSTTATKAIAWDAAGAAVAEGRAPVALDNPRLGWFEQDPEDWRSAARAVLADCLAGLDPARVQGLAVSNQRETVAFLDAEGRAVRPAITWIDERARTQVRTVPEAVGAERIHAITGRWPDLTPCLYRIAWVRENERDAFAATRTVADVQTVLVRDLCGGPPRTGWASADPMGLFDLREKAWSAPLLAAVGLDAGRLPEPHPPGTPLGAVTAEAAAATGLPEGCPVFAGGGDGQLAGLGAGCTMPERAYVNLGTAVVSGVWSPDCLIDRGWRTEIAGQGEGYILETCLRSGTFLVNWLVERVMGAAGDPGVFDRLEAEARGLPIGSDGVMVLPYWSGVMDPHWDVDARGAILGLSGSHGQAHLHRAILEGITLTQAAATAAQEAATGRPVEHYVAIGGGARSALWRQMLADASGRPVRVSGTVEASALGAGMIAAYGAGWFGSIEEAAAAMAGETTEVAPDPTTAERYAELSAIHAGLYDATAETSRRLVAFAAGHTAPGDARATAEGASGRRASAGKAT